jgi:hypothetical protein
MARIRVWISRLVQKNHPSGSFCDVAHGQRGHHGNAHRAGCTSSIPLHEDTTFGRAEDDVDRLSDQVEEGRDAAQLVDVGGLDQIDLTLELPIYERPAGAIQLSLAQLVGAEEHGDANSILLRYLG